MRSTDLAELGGYFRDAGCRGWVHACPVQAAASEGGGAGRGSASEVALDADDRLPVASVYKLGVAAVWADLVDRGALDPVARLRLDPADRTPGPTGVAALDDPVEMSARDVVRLMLTLSDNAAADHVLDLLGGPARVTEVLAGWGVDLVVRHGSRGTQEAAQADTGTEDHDAVMRALADIHRDVRTSQYDAALASSASPRGLTTLLSMLWRGEIAPGEGGAHVRASLARQVWPHRLRAGFPHDDVEVAGKTGTLGVLRHEVGVVTFPGEVPVAVAVLTRSARPEAHLPVVDAAIGRAAAAAVRPLRRQDARRDQSPGAERGTG
ncbi:serine hydrolase [Janibacter alkaliphilus]|uniref:Beta-lactamase class A n=1 Tax=Janibacter alkaliphilus TaxID=1069963 RepID=A0A852XB29_9MICO|nr:serine hydrolase [Janibacter alkaliphilus]NYG37943.1 beta-lactamase class A [Janibacter alkaliphilus]